MRNRRSATTAPSVLLSSADEASERLQKMRAFTSDDYVRAGCFISLPACVGVNNGVVAMREERP